MLKHILLHLIHNYPDGKKVIRPECGERKHGIRHICNDIHRGVLEALSLNMLQKPLWTAMPKTDPPSTGHSASD